MLKQSNANEIKQLIVLVKTARKENRKNLIENIAKKFIELQKFKTILGFPREHLNDLFEYDKKKSDNANERQRERLIKEIISYLLEKKIVKEIKTYKQVKYWRLIKEISSYDFGSYNAMMSHNGYKKYLYKWVNQKGEFPKRVLVKTLPMGEKINKELEFDFIETKSTKPKANQGIKSNGNKTICNNNCGLSTKKVYEILN